MITPRRPASRVFGLWTPIFASPKRAPPALDGGRRLAFRQLEVGGQKSRAKGKAVKEEGKAAAGGAEMLPAVAAADRPARPALRHHPYLYP